MLVNGHTGTVSHKRFFNIVDEINSGDLIILNNTQVIPARFFGRKESEGKVEFLVERILSVNKVLVKIKNSKNMNIGTNIFLAIKIKLKVLSLNIKTLFLKFFFTAIFIPL